MRNPSQSHHTRLIDHHAFLYERKAYPNYVNIEPQDAIKNFPAIWEWLTAAIGETECREHPPLCTQSAFILLWPEIGDGPATWCCSRPDTASTTAVAAARTSNADACLLQWVGVDDSLVQTGSPTPAGEHLIVVFYLLRERNGKSRNDLQEIEDFLDTVLFVGRRGDPLRLVSTSGMLPESQGQYPASVDEFITYLSQHHHDGRYYQRIAVGFSCRDEHHLTLLAACARDVVVSLITHWGYEIEKRNAESSGAEEQARAWAHEIGNCISFLNRDNLTSYPHLYDWARLFIDFHIISATKHELPDVCKPWPRWNGDSIVNSASKLAAQMAVLRQFRGNAENVGTTALANAQMRSFQARLAPPEVCTAMRINDAFVAIPTENAYKGRNRFAAFAQLLICGLYNAMQNSPREKSIRLSLERSALTITNPRVPSGQHDHNSLSGGTKATLRMAYQTLWDHEPPCDVHFDKSDDGKTWILEAMLPETMWSDPCL